MTDDDDDDDDDELPSMAGSVGIKMVLLMEFYWAKSTRVVVLS